MLKLAKGKSELQRLRSLKISKRLKDLEAKTSDLHVFKGALMTLLRERYGDKETRRMLGQLDEGEN